MFTLAKHTLTFALGALVLGGCATQAPRLSGTPSYVLSAIDAEGGARGAELAAALEATPLALNGAPTVAFATITVDLVRYDSPILGFFYGGPDHASLSVSLTNANGASLGAFDVFVGVDAVGTAADVALAEKAAAIIAAKAANAWPAMSAKPKAAPVPAPTTAPVVADVPAIEPAPAVDGLADPATPCVIGADGKCIPL
jgi:hypothetical protein